ncbi:MAG: hypothetical protein QM811_15580 [Pirellulales bacterium]
MVSTDATATRAFAHLGVTNVTFCDGHTEALTECFTETDEYDGPTNIGDGTGFLGPQ